MKLLDSSVIVWTKDRKGRPFNDINKADKYFHEERKKKHDPIWQRIFFPKTSDK